VPWVNAYQREKITELFSVFFVPLFCQPLKEHSSGMNHIDPRLQGKKKGKPDHRNLLMKSIREDG
jgi:hypothetical protein